MFDFGNMFNAFDNVFQLINLFAMLIGSIVGVIVGALPGATATMAIAVMIPITFWFEPEFSLLMLISVYCSGVFGGSISAILLNIPGTPASAATCFDGHPLAMKGQGGKAIMVALVASTIGGLISGIALMFCSPALAALALNFGAPESMMVAIFGLTMVASLSSENLAKGFLMGLVGMFIGTIGLSPGGTARFIFGNPNLYSGLAVVPMLIGVFSIPEVLSMITSKGWSKPEGHGGALKLSWAEFRSLWKTLGICTAVGLIIGIIPAIGPETATFVGYDQAKRNSKNKDMFGKGAIEGIAASESANNAVCGTSLAPMFALGIPGSGAAMVLMGALMIHGLMPGPQLFRENQSLLMTLFLGFIVAQLFMFASGYVAALFAPHILNIHHLVLGPIILIVCMVGTFACNNNIFDVYVMLIAGVFSFFMGKAGYSPVPLVLGMILGPMFEAELSRTLILASKTGFMSYMMGRPIALLLFALTVFSMVAPIIVEQKKKRKLFKYSDNSN